MHLAAAYGVPCAIVFAAVDRRGRWFPIGEGHRPIYHQVECAVCKLPVCIEKKKICIESVTVEEMFKAALEAIEKKPDKPVAGDEVHGCIAEVKRD
jgi:ADP-heptose:LPS heptosyltransferase